MRPGERPPRSRRRRRTALTLAAALAAVALVPALAQPAAAAPGDPLPAPTAGVQILDVGGEPFGYLPTTDGHRWFPICPAGDPPAPDDVCGGSGAPSSGTVPGTFSGLDFYVDQADARCQVVAAHNDRTDPADVVLPRKCFQFPLMFGVASRAVLGQVVEAMGRKVGACPAQKVACDNDLAYWPVTQGHLDCANLPADHLPAEVKSYAGTDPAKLTQVCRVLDSYVTGTPPAAAIPAAAAQALGPAAAALYVSGSGGRADTDLDWGGLFEAGLGAAGKRALQAAACVASAPECFSQWLGGWLVEGFRAELGLIKASITQHGSISTILRSPGYRQLYGTVGLISVWVVTIMLLFSILASVLRAEPWGIVRAAGGVLAWGYTWTLGLVVTLGVIALSDQLTDFIGRIGTGSTDKTVDRFSTLVNSGIPGGATLGTWTVVGLALVGVLVAGFQWLLTQGRDASIAVIALGLPIALAMLAGPPRLRGSVRQVAATGGVIIFAKPVTALMFVLGNVVMASTTGISVVAVGVLVLALACVAPFALYKLFAAGLVAAEAGLTGGRGTDMVRAGADLLSAADRARRSYSGSRPQPVHAGSDGSAPAAGSGGRALAGGGSAAAATGAGAGAVGGPAGAAAAVSVGVARRALEAAGRATDAANPGGTEGSGAPQGAQGGAPVTVPSRTPPGREGAPAATGTTAGGAAGTSSVGPVRPAAGSAGSAGSVSSPVAASSPASSSAPTGRAVAPPAKQPPPRRDDSGRGVRP